MSTLLKPLERITFFIDRSLGRKIIPEALRRVGEDVRVHDDLFPQDSNDEAWLKEVGQKNWIAITHDQSIRYRANEFSAVCDHRVRLFVIASKGSLSGEEVANIILEALPKIKKMVQDTRPPFVAKVLRGGQVHRIGI